MVNAWVAHVRKHVSPTMTYKQAMMDPKVKALYHARNSRTCARRLTACEKRCPPKKRKPRKK